MATSPLVAAMLGGSEGGSMLGMDPAIMQAMPDLNLAQAMMQRGLSTAPASPMQAVAQMAQTAAGMGLRNEATSQLAQAYAGSAENMAKVFDQTAGPGNIVSRML